MQIRDAEAEDGSVVAEILNHEIDTAPEIWLEAHVSPENRTQWIADRQSEGFPVLVAEEDGKVLGFGSFGPFRPYYGFRNTVEHLVYVSSAARGKGVGRSLLNALIEKARARAMKVIVGAVDAQNEGSLKLHQALGFIETGRMTRIGEKWGIRRTMVLFQKELAET